MIGTHLQYASRVKERMAPASSAVAGTIDQASLTVMRYVMLEQAAVEAADHRHEVAVDREVVPLQHVADRAGNDRGGVGRWFRR